MTRRCVVLIETIEARMMLSTVATPTFRMGNPAGGTVIRPAYSAQQFTGGGLRKAYGIDTATYAGASLDGSGQTIAIIDAYDAPTITTDLAAFNSMYGLPNSTLVVRNQSGGTSRPLKDPSGAGDSWAVETALDVEWMHAFAPKATILLVLADSSEDGDLNVATDYARNYPGVSVISMSYGSDEYLDTDTGASSYDDDFHYTTPSGHTGITFFSSSGDNGAYSPDTTTQLVGYPASSPNVVGVGGTKLSTLASGLYGSETGWGSGEASASSTGNGGSGGGVSLYAPKPSYQSSITLGGSKRAVPDVSFVADPASGVGVIDAYDNKGSTTPFNVGGTSLSSPLWGGLMALVNQARGIAGLGTMNGLTETLPKLYSLPQSDFHDITSGNNGYAAGVGYDLVTGRGTPVVQSMINDMVGFVAGPIIGSFAANPASIVVGAASTTLTATVTDASSSLSSLNFYSETNGTAGLQLTGSTPDALVGSGVASSSTYSYTLATSSLAIGTYTYYARATDAAAATATATTTLKVVSGATSGPILGFNIAGQTGFGTQGLAADTVAPGLTASLGLTRGAGVTVPSSGAAANAWGGTNWRTSSATALSTDAAVSFGTTVQSGFTLSLSNIALTYRRSSTGAASGLWQYQLNGGSWVTIADVASEFSVSGSPGGTITPIDLSAIGALQGLTAGTSVNLRVVPYASTSATGTWYVNNGVASGDDIVVNGIVSTVATASPPTVVTAPTATLDAARTVATLAVLGADSGTAGEAGITYTWSITGKPTGSTATFGMNGTNAAKNSTLNVDLAGVYTLLVTLTGPTGLTSIANVTLNVPLVASGGLFLDQTAPLRAIFNLNGNAGSSIGLDDFVLTDTTTNTTVALPSGASVSFDATTNIATLNFGTTLPSGRYRITMGAAGVSAGTTTLVADYGFTFSFLDGDVNDSGAVDFADLLLLAKNYGSTTATRATGDVNVDGAVNFSDLLILAKNYGASLPVPSASYLPASTFASSATPTRTKNGNSIASDVL